MSYPQKSYYSPDRINQITQQLSKSTFINPKKQSSLTFSPSKIQKISSQKFIDCFYHSRPINYLCIAENCQCKYFMLCDHEQCKNMHYHPNLNIIQLQKFNIFKQNHLKSINLLKQKIGEYQKNVIQTIVHKLVKDFEFVRNVVDRFYVHKAAKKISQGHYQLLTAKELNEFIQKSINLQSKPINTDQLQTTFIESKNMIIDQISRINESIKKLTESKEYKSMTLQEIIVDNSSIHGYQSPKSYIKKETFSSKIIQFQEEYLAIIKMLRENRIVNFQEFKLLYRASENQFSAQKYHTTVDNRMPIFLLILAETGRKFGAYLNCKPVLNNDWISDPTGLSFIYSLDHNQTYRIKPSAQYRTKAIFGGDKGPQIGLGCDIYLSDKCNQNYQSGANFGGSFQLPFGIDFNTKKARSYLAGKQNFQVLEYQAYTLI